MYFNEIHPFIRYAHYLSVNEGQAYNTTVPLDARLFFVLEGYGKIKFEDSVIELPVGSALFINSGTPYKIMPSEALYLAYNFDFTENYSNIEIPIPPVKWENGKKYNIIEHIQFEDAYIFDQKFAVYNVFFLQNNLETIEKEFLMKLPYYREKTSHIFTAVLCDLLRKFESGLRRHDRFDSDSVAEYIRQHYNKPINNQILAEHFGLHPNYISSEFKRCTGMPLHKYLLHIRIYKAIAFLEEGNLTVSQVAEMVGFEDNNYFARYFKKITGMSPKSFINNKR